MEIKFYNTEDVKEKFALLVAKLHDASLPTDYIEKVIIESSFFDCFETNELDAFMNMSFETITKNIFGKEMVFNQTHNYINSYYWAGLAIMEIMMNLEIPIKRILIVLPLKEIVECYDVFHEMNFSQFLDYYKEKEKSVFVLKQLRNKANLSLPKISYLTGIKMSILSLMDNSNATLLSTSFSNLCKLANLFDISIDLFKTKSSYIPYSSYLINNKQFQNYMIVTIFQYFGIEKDVQFITSHKYLEDKEIRNLLVNNKVVVDLSNPYGVFYIASKHVVRKYLSNQEFVFIYKKSIDEYKYLSTDSLMF